MTPSTTTDKVRQQVSETYGQRITEESSCCSDSCCPTLPEGYEQEALAGKDAPTSYGCGNPLAFSEVREGQTVVDLGSGAGLDLLIAADRVGPEGRVIGIDMTDQMIAEAERNIAKSGHRNVEVRKGIIEEMPLEESSADWVISNCVINLSPEKNRVFAEIARVLRPGGRLSVTDIVVDGLPEELRGSQSLYDSCVAGAIPEADYVAGLRSAGLVDVQAEELVVYDASMLRGLASEFDFPPEVVEAWLPNLEGSVRSLRFSARMPA